MAFSFKPDISQDAQGAIPPTSSIAPSAPFGGSSAQTIASRHVEEGKSLVELALSAVCGIVILLALGLVGYKFYLSSQIDKKKAILQNYETKLGGLPLEEMRKMSNRIKVINQLIKDHPSANVAFRIIEESVENKIMYTGFELKNADKGYTLLLKGTAPDYKSIAQQVDTLKRKPYSNYVSNINVDGMIPDKGGEIKFNLKMTPLVTGKLPEELNFSDGAAAVNATQTPSTVVSGVQPQSQATTTAASSTPKR